MTGSGSREQYLRKHWFKIRTKDHQVMTLYFDRQARSTLDIASVPQSAQTSSTSSSEALYIQARFVEGRKAESWPPK